MNSPRQSKLWHVLGAGAMGCLWAGALREAGHEVTLLLRDARSLEAFRSGRGITLLEGDQRRLVHCDADLAEAPHAPFDRLLICCKAHQTLAAAAEFLGIQPGTAAAEHDSPPLGDLTADLGATPDTGAFLAAWFGFAWSALEELRLTEDAVDVERTQLWPGHFDAALAMGDGDAGARATFATPSPIST